MKYSQNSIFANESNNIIDEEVSAHSTSLPITFCAVFWVCSCGVQSPCSIIYSELLFTPYRNGFFLLFLVFLVSLYLG